MKIPNLLSIIGRSEFLFQKDFIRHSSYIDQEIRNSRFLVIGGAGSIGAAVVRELFQRQPKVLHVVDISENNLTELVRDIRSSMGYISGEFKTFCLDILGIEYEAFMLGIKEQIGSYDYVLNFSALKHVRSEKDPFTLMRLIKVNIFGTLRTLHEAKNIGAKKYFCVSTDKAANPVNLMGASKKIMECFLARENQLPVSTARFANVAFSDGSLPYGWMQRILKRQPIVAPKDIKRYFITDAEGAILCLFSILQGQNREIFFPKLSEHLHLITFADMAKKFLHSQNLEPIEVSNEDEARNKVEEFAAKNAWPCYFPKTDTTGEKDFEEFYTHDESVDWNRYSEIAVVSNPTIAETSNLNTFETRIEELCSKGSWSKSDIITLFKQVLPDFSHKETGKYLDGKM